ncbi:MAG: hypothetical protein ACN6PQ_01825 [Stenotrophomonas indicatrix]|uniref:hypothetical protein n=1 Tax=Stenotrophomonas indicatrix TaxID=2045451 RepID=UPI003D0A322D
MEPSASIHGMRRAGLHGVRVSQHTEWGTLDVSGYCCERSLVLELQHAAQHVCVDGYTDQQIGDFHRNALLLAARQIAHAAHADLGDAITAVANKSG